MGTCDWLGQKIFYKIYKISHDKEKGSNHEKKNEPCSYLWNWNCKLVHNTQWLSVYHPIRSHEYLKLKIKEINKKNRHY